MGNSCSQMHQRPECAPRRVGHVDPPWGCSLEAPLATLHTGSFYSKRLSPGR